MSRKLIAAAMLVAAAQGFARGAPRVITLRNQHISDPPMPGILPAIIPEPITRAVAARRERRRIKPESELAIIAAAQAKRARKCARNIKIARFA